MSQQMRRQASSGLTGFIIVLGIGMCVFASCHHEDDPPHYATSTYEGADGKMSVHCAGIYGDMKCHDDSAGQP